MSPLTQGLNYRSACDTEVVKLLLHNNANVNASRTDDGAHLSILLLTMDIQKW